MNGQQVDHVVEVRVVDGSSGEAPEVNPFAPAEVEKKSVAHTPPKGQSQLKTAALTTMLQSTGKTLFSQALGSYGLLTGDHIGQAHIDEAQSLSLYASAIIANPVAGSLYTAVDVGAKIGHYEINKSIHDTKAAAMRERRGILESSGGRL